eukprot:4372381-Prymnesium_polylepis.2
MQPPRSNRRRVQSSRGSSRSGGTEDGHVQKRRRALRVTAAIPVASAAGTIPAKLMAPIKAWRRQRIEVSSGSSSRTLGAVSSSILATHGTSGSIVAACWKKAYLRRARARSRLVGRRGGRGWTCRGRRWVGEGRHSTRGANPGWLEVAHR